MDAAKKRLEFNNYLINKNSEQTDFFEHSYKSYNNFTRFTKKINFNNNFDFGKTSSIEFNELAKYGDIITNMIISFELPSLIDKQTVGGDAITYGNSIGFNIVESIDFLIGGNIIDRHTPEIMDIYSELLTNTETRTNIDKLVNKLETIDAGVENFNSLGGLFYTPLQFWFCRNMVNKEMSLPLFLLYRDTLELRCNIRNFNKIVITPVDITNTDFSVNETYTINNPVLIVEYIILDTKERRRLLELNITQTKYFLIYQVQEIKINITNGEKTANINMETFKYLITQLFWIYKNDSNKNRNRHLDYSVTINTDGEDIVYNPLLKCQLTYEKQDVTDKMYSRYFVEVEPYLNNMNAPRIKSGKHNKFINTFSFSVDPKKLEQPSGICNFSELHCPDLHIDFVSDITSGSINIYAINYNVLQVKNGKGVLYHNLSKSMKSTFPDKK
jgi:hypothetical protein